jgi:hypothetical protein
VYEANSSFECPERIRKLRGGFGYSKKLDEPVSHFKGFEREALGKHSPGPGVYKPISQIYSRLGGKINPESTGQVKIKLPKKRPEILDD